MEMGVMPECQPDLDELHLILWWCYTYLLCTILFMPIYYKHMRTCTYIHVATKQFSFNKKEWHEPDTLPNWALRSRFSLIKHVHFPHTKNNQCGWKREGLISQQIHLLVMAFLQSHLLTTERSLISQKRISLSVSHYQRPTLSLWFTHTPFYLNVTLYSSGHSLSPPTPKTCLSFSTEHYAIAYGIIKSKLATLLFSSYMFYWSKWLWWSDDTVICIVSQWPDFSTKKKTIKTHAKPIYILIFTPLLLF